MTNATIHELQQAGVRAAKFDRIWSSSGVTSTRQLEFDTTSLVLQALKSTRPFEDDDASVLLTAWSCVQHVESLPGDIILTVHSSQHLILWRVPRGEDEARHTDIHALIAGQPFGGLVVDRTPGPTTNICVAVLGHNTATLCVAEFDPLHAKLGRLNYLNADMPPRTLWAMRGNLVLYSDPPMVVDTETRKIRFLIQPDPNLVQATPVIAATFLFDDLVLVVQRQAILVLRIAPCEADDIIGVVPFHAESQYQLEASIVLAPSLVSREGWTQPVATIVGLSPNMMTSTPLYYKASTDGTSGEWHVGEKAERFTPPSATGIVMGTAGRGIWLENRPQLSIGPAGRRHGRSASDARPMRCVVGLDVPLVRTGAPSDASADDLQADLLRVQDKSLFERPCGMGEVVTRKYGIMSATIDDAAGRIVLGNRDGKVRVMDFA
jgi:hypothetical protein